MRALIALALAFYLIPLPSQAQMSCGPRDVVVANLGQKYGEVRRGAGLTGSISIYELWASEETGSWTILKTSPNGWTCIMAVGDHWQEEPRGIEL